MMYILSIEKTEKECSGTILEEVQIIGKNPDSYLYLVDGTPTPMDTVPEDGKRVECIRVASGG